MSAILADMAKQLKRHPALIPLLLFIGVGPALSVLYMGRMVLKCPDIAWTRSNPEPWTAVAPNHQYKLFSVTTDYSSYKKEGPDF